MNFDDSLKRGTFYSFIPRRLEIESREELKNLPFNIMFASYGIKEGRQVMGSSVYEPDFSTLNAVGGQIAMTYRNKFGGDHWVRVSYDRTAGSYKGEKHINSKCVGEAYGQEWKMFFVHLTALGLSNGENCEFTPLAR